MPYQVFATADGFIVLAIGNDSQFRRFCEFAGCEELADDERFATNDSRVRNREDAVAALNPILAAHPSSHWLVGLEQRGIGCGPINNLAQVFDDPHVRARGMVTEVPHPAIDGAPAKLIASPLRLSATPVEIRHAPPMLGQHTEQVLGEVLGMDADEIEALKAAQAI